MESGEGLEHSRGWVVHHRRSHAQCHSEKRGILGSLLLSLWSSSGRHLVTFNSGIVAEVDRRHTMVTPRRQVPAWCKRTRIAQRHCDAVVIPHWED